MSEGYFCAVCQRTDSTDHNVKWVHCVQCNLSMTVCDLTCKVIHPVKIVKGFSIRKQNGVLYECDYCKLEREKKKPKQDARCAKKKLAKEEKKSLLSI